MSNNNEMWPLLTLAVDAGNFKEVERITNIVTSLKQWPTGFDCLYNSIYSGQIEIAKFLINRDCPLETYNNNKILLNVAFLRGHVEIVEMLLEKGVSCSVQDDKGLTPLDLLISSYFTYNAQFINIFNLIVSNTNINLINRVTGYTALHYAVDIGNYNIIQLLVDSNCHLNIKSDNGLTPLHIAAMKGNFQIVSLLLYYKAKYNILTKKKETALCLAVQSGDIATIEILLNRTLKFTRKLFQEPLLVYHAVITGKIVIIELLLLHGAAVNAYSPETGKTALHVACEKDNEDIVRLLLKKGANPRAIQNSNKGKSVGSTPLHIAVKNEQGGIVNLLLQCSVLPGAVDEFNRTPLHLAAEIGSFSIVSTLLKSIYGHNDNHMCMFTYDEAKGFTPLHIAVENGSEDIVELFLDHGIPVEMLTKAGLQSLHIAVQKQNHRMVKILLKYGADVNAAGQSEFETPLYLAAEIGNLKIIEILSEASPTRSLNWIEAYFPLYIAAHEGHHKVVEMLLCKGANPNANFRTYLTPLHAAVHRGHKKVVELFLEYGAEIDPKNAGNHSISTPLLAAFHARHKEMIFLLLDCGAKVNVRLGSAPDKISLGVKRLLTYGDYADSEIQGNKSKIGFTPLHFAVEAKSKTLVKLLLNLRANINVMSASLITPVQIAVQENLELLVGDLISAGANVDNHLILQTAISQKNEKIVQLLLKAKIHVNAKSVALPIAVETEQARIVRDLLEAGANVSVNPTGIPILNIALSKENIEICEMLLKAGVDVNSTLGNNSQPALHVAIKTKNQSIVEMLLKYGVDVNINFRKNVPLYLAVNEDLLNIAQILLEAGADPNNMTSFQPILFKAIMKQNRAMVDLLLKHNALLNFSAIKHNNKECRHCSPLHVAVSESSVEIVELLLQKGSSVDIELEEFPLHDAVISGKMSNVNQLLKYGAHINSVCKNNKTPLMHAMQQGSIEMVKLLVLKGANVELKTETVNSLLNYILENNINTDIIKLLFDCGLNVDTSCKCCSSIYKVLEKVTPQFDDYSSSDEMDESDEAEYDSDLEFPFRESEASEEEMRDESEAEDDIDQDNIMESGSREFETSEEEMEDESADEEDRNDRYMITLKLLLSYGADANAIAVENGESVLHFATRIAKSNAVKLLIQNGADVNFLDHLGNSPLKYAMDRVIYNLYDFEIYDFNSIVRVEFANCARFIIKEIARLAASNYEITEQNKNLVNSDHVKDLYKWCQEELKQMQNKKICSWLKYFDILSENCHKLAICIRNKKVIEALSYVNYAKEFPLYATDLKARIRQAKERNIFAEKSVQPLKKALSFEFPYLIREKIFDYLSTRDLRNLCIACNPVIFLKTKKLSKTSCVL